MEKKEIKEIFKVIDQEIKWSKDNHTKGDKYEKGFIAGLLQARALIKILLNPPPKREKGE